MSIPAIPSFETIKKWVGYWRKFKGKRVRVYLRSGVKFDYSLPNPLKPLTGDTAFQTVFAENFTGTISEIVESPFGIMLKDILFTTDANIEKMFIPMSEITKMDILKTSK
jgi:hypothetical protein